MLDIIRFKCWLLKSPTGIFVCTWQTVSHLSKQGRYELFVCTLTQYDSVTQFTAIGVMCCRVIFHFSSITFRDFCPSVNSYVHDVSVTSQQYYILWLYQKLYILLLETHVMQLTNFMSPEIVEFRSHFAFKQSALQYL